MYVGHFTLAISRKLTSLCKTTCIDPLLYHHIVNNVKQTKKEEKREIHSFTFIRRDEICEIIILHRRSSRQ